MLLLSTLSSVRALSTSAVPKVVFLGTPEVAAASLQKIYDYARSSSTFELSSVVTQPPRRAGRKKRLQPTPVQLTTESLSPDIKILTPENAKEDDFLSTLESLSPDLMITAAYGCYLPKRFLRIPRLGTVNIHPSLLPRWRGASPVQRSLEAGDEEIGVTVLYTVTAMDAGPIISQVSRPNDGVKGASEEVKKSFVTL